MSSGGPSGSSGSSGGLSRSIGGGTSEFYEWGGFSGSSREFSGSFEIKEENTKLIWDNVETIIEIVVKILENWD